MSFGILSATDGRRVLSKSITLACAGVILHANLAFGQSSILLNGSFENNFASWTATGNQVIATNDPSHPASQGSKVVVLNPNTTLATAVLSQTFATTAGQRYALAFDVGRMGGVIDGRLRVQVQGGVS